MGLFALALLSAASSVTGCHAVDGDTLRCGRERIRLLAIDAPEMGRCQRGRRCAPGDPHRSTKNLQGALDATIKIERLGKDRYGRTLALVRSSKGDLSCLQLRSGNAIYRADWDNGRRLSRICRR
ncbi:thermonuclease family protein [Sphingomonas turrisvirgatae]|uniref:thermonuclease family protein n=1 Tax=Sphingomonas turrisvirgatae TaxID=1888892 RepID=UPI0009A1953F|nr:thermonuclease family protein [Sphingomonas turrisvirgatae]